MGSRVHFCLWKRAASGTVHPWDQFIWLCRADGGCLLNAPPAGTRYISAMESRDTTMLARFCAMMTLYVPREPPLKPVWAYLSSRSTLLHTRCLTTSSSNAESADLSERLLAILPRGPLSHTRSPPPSPIINFPSIPLPSYPSSL